MKAKTGTPPRGQSCLLIKSVGPKILSRCSEKISALLGTTPREKDVRSLSDCYDITSELSLCTFLPNCAKSFVTREGIQDREKQVVAPKVTVTVPADGKWHEYAD